MKLKKIHKKLHLWLQPHRNKQMGGIKNYMSTMLFTTIPLVIVACFANTSPSGGPVSSFRLTGRWQDSRFKNEEVLCAPSA
jgi:hypothetical protein